MSFFSDADTWALVIQELDSRLFQRLLDLHERRGARADLPAKGFHAADSADGDARPLCKFDLFPTKQRPRGAQLSSGDHEATVTRRRSQPQETVYNNYIIDYDIQIVRLSPDYEIQGL